MKKSIVVISTILALALLAGCAAPTPAPTPVPTEAPVVETETPVVTEAPTEAPAADMITVTDALDRTIEFETLPSRIVIVGKADFMILNAAFLFPEAIEKVIGYEARSQTGLDFIQKFYPATQAITMLEKDAGPEQIAPLQPDLVLMKSYLSEKLGKVVEEVGIKVVYLDLETPEAIYGDIRTLGAVFGNPERAETLVADYEATVKSITDSVSALKDEEKPTVLMLQYSQSGEETAFEVPPAEWLQTQLVELAGGVPVWKDAITDGGWTVVTLEQIAAWNPQVILLIDYDGNAVEVVNNLKADASWSLLDSVKNGKLYAFPLDFQSWDQPDTRWTLGLTWVAMKLHPDLFSTVNLNDEVISFYETFYNLDKATIESEIIPLLKGDL